MALDRSRNPVARDHERVRAGAPVADPRSTVRLGQPHLQTSLTNYLPAYQGCWGAFLSLRIFNTFSPAFNYPRLQSDSTILPWKWNREVIREIDHSLYEGSRDAPFRSRVVADCSGSRLASPKEANPSKAANDSFMHTQKQKEISQEIELYTTNLGNHVAEKTDNSWAESDAEMNHRATRRELSLCVFVCLLVLFMRAGVLPVHKSGLSSIVARESRVGRFFEPTDQSLRPYGSAGELVANASPASVN
jgi:hypothetical protein